jgi:large subunit ribosomal protein L18
MGFVKYKTSKDKRKLRIRKRAMKQENRYRLSVFRSNKYNYAQIIDDFARKTLVSASESDLTAAEKKKTKTERARLVGVSLASKAKKAKVKMVVFDRGQYQYHGRIKALADGAREGGLDF